MGTNSRTEREKAHFERLALERGLHWWGNATKAGKLRQEIRAKLAARCLALKAGDALLEIGCGAGDFTKYLCQLGSGISITAIDISPALIELAKNNLQYNNVSFKEGDVENLPFEPGCFGVVVGNAILHHLNLEKVLPELRRVLKIGGKIFFTEPNMLNPQVFLEKNFRFIGSWLDNSPDETAFSRWGIKRQLEKAGFENIQVQPFDFLHPLVPDRLIPLFITLSSVLEKMPIVREIGGALVIFGTKK